MDKKVLIISSSPRKGGNSETLAAAFAKGALEAGNEVETVYLREKQYGFCKGCFACLKLMEAGQSGEVPYITHGDVEAVKRAVSDYMK